MNTRIFRVKATLAGSYILPMLLLILFPLMLVSSHKKLAAQDDGSQMRDDGVDTFHGTREFAASGTFIVPDHVSTILVDTYGAGGGGGGGGTNPGQFGGCPGGEGAYSRSVIKVRRHMTLDVSVGQGGIAGVNGVSPTNGTNGGDSSISLNGFPLITAHGGDGGQSGVNLTKTPEGFTCSNATGGSADPTAMISHAGSAGGPGYQLIGFPVGTLVSSAGVPNGNQPGEPGYVLLTY
jgi:hypothetical protein